MNIHQVVDAFVERLRADDVSFKRIESAPWTVDFEAKLPRHLPQSFLSLVTRYRFSRFEYKQIELFGNINGQSEEDFVVAACKDPYLWEPAVSQGFVQFGRPAGGSYDPICFDMRKPCHGSEWPIVWLDHEQLLQFERAQIRKEIAKSFFALIQSSQ